MEAIIKINKKSKAAKLFLEYVKTLSFAKVEEPEILYNAETEKAIKKSREGKNITKTESHADLMKKLRC
jgi:antitoxin component of RelBE/YafQ-DinJ toxin-antitoxin module